MRRREREKGTKEGEIKRGRRGRSYITDFQKSERVAKKQAGSVPPRILSP
jgi:hypothetical protein